MNTDSNLSNWSWWVDWKFYHFFKNSLFKSDSYFIKVKITLDNDFCLIVYFLKSECFAISLNAWENYLRLSLSNSSNSRPDCEEFDYSIRIDFHYTNAILTLELSILLMMVDCTTMIVCLKLSCTRKHSFHLANDTLNFCSPCIFSITLFNLVCLLIFMNDSASMDFLMVLTICYAAYSLLTPVLLLLLSWISCIFSVIIKF